MSKLEIRDLHVAVEDTPILKGVDLTVESGQTHAIMGPNGSGKSTLAYAVAGHPAYRITEGSILLDGRDVTEAEADEAQRLVVRGFFADVIDRIGLPDLQARIMTAIEARLGFAATEVESTEE